MKALLLIASDRTPQGWRTWAGEALRRCGFEESGSNVYVGQAEDIIRFMNWLIPISRPHLGFMLLRKQPSLAFKIEKHTENSSKVYVTWDARVNDLLFRGVASIRDRMRVQEQLQRDMALPEPKLPNPS